jgi:hypothetical protein
MLYELKKVEGVDAILQAAFCHLYRAEGFGSEKTRGRQHTSCGSHQCRPRVQFHEIELSIVKTDGRIKFYSVVLNATVGNRTRVVGRENKWQLCGAVEGYPGWQKL